MRSEHIGYQRALLQFGESPANYAEPAIRDLGSITISKATEALRENLAKGRSA